MQSNVTGFFFTVTKPQFCNQMESAWFNQAINHPAETREEANNSFPSPANAQNTPSKLFSVAVNQIWHGTSTRR